MTGVEVVEIRPDGLVGSFCFRRDRPGPGVVALSGSDGGIPLHLARLLAEEGFSCLALGYFGAPGLPRRLINIRLEYVRSAVDWLRTQPEFTGDRVGLIGASKGAELALVSAATFPDAIAAVVAYAPSCVVFPGISFRRGGRRKSSWSYQGQPLPFVPYPRPIRPSLGLKGVSMASTYQRALKEADPATLASARIRLEHSDAAIMLLSGGKDGMWPASAMAETLMTRLAASGQAHQAEHVHFPDAGHSFMPWQPALRSRLAIRAINGARLAGFGVGFDLGGRVSANRQALQESWARVVPFLREHLTSTSAP